MSESVNSSILSKQHKLNKQLDFHHILRSRQIMKSFKLCTVIALVIRRVKNLNETKLIRRGVGVRFFLGVRFFIINSDD